MIKSDLIFDVGCHSGEDTEFYLRKGFRVVAVEANPDLCASLRQRFASEISEGRLTLVEKAISDKDGSVTFYQNERSIWGSISPKHAERNLGFGYQSKAITVSATTFGSLIDQYGCPYYAKIDIEGADRLCLLDLLKRRDRPAYLSVESERASWRELKGELNLIASLGYDRFQVINQETVPLQTLPNPQREGREISHIFAAESSGPFGRDLEPSRWLTQRGALGAYRRIFLTYLLFGDRGILRSQFLNKVLHKIGLLDWWRNRVFLRYVNRWYDVHARHSSAR